MAEKRRMHMATSQIHVWDPKLKKYVYKTANVLENDYVKQQQARKVLDGVNNIVKGNKNIADRTITGTSAAVIQPAKQNTASTQVKTASTSQNPVINSIADMIQTARQKKDVQNKFSISTNPVEARKQLDTAVKQSQAVKPKEISIDDKIKQNLARMRELANKETLTDAEKSEGYNYYNDLADYYRVHGLDQFNKEWRDSNYNKTLASIKNNLELKTRAGAGMGLGLFNSLPGMEYLMNWAEGSADDYKNKVAEDTGVKAAKFENAKTNQPEAYLGGDIAGSILQLIGVGGVIKGGTTAAKLAPKLMEKGFSKTAANAIEKGVANLGLAGYSTVNEALKPGYDTSNLGQDALSNTLLYGVTGAVGDVAGSALNTAVAKSGLTGLQKGLAAVGARTGKGLAAAGAGVASTLPTYSEEDMPSRDEILNQIFTLAIFNALDGGEVRNDIVKRVSKPQSEYFKGIKTAEELKAVRNALAKKYSPDIGGSNEIMAQINADYDTVLEYLKNNPATSNVFRDTIQKIRDWISGLKNRASRTPAGQQQNREAIALLEDTLKSTGQKIPTGTTAAATGNTSRALGGLPQYPSAEKVLKAPKTPADIPAITSMAGEEKATEILEDIPGQNIVTGKDTPDNRKAKPVTGNGTQNTIYNFTSIGSRPSLLRSDLVNAQAPPENEGRIEKQRGTGNPVLDRIRMLIQNGSGITRGNASGASNRTYEQNPVLDGIRALTQNHMMQFAKPADRNSHIPLGQTKTPDGAKAVLENNNAQWDKAAGALEKFAAQMKKQGLFLDERQLRVLKTIADGVAGMREKQAVANNKAKKLIQAVLSYAADLKTQEGNTADRGAPDVADQTGQSIIGTEGAGNNVSGRIYTPVEYNGTVKVNGEVKDVSRRVYQRNDIDINYFDETTGLTNLERMQAGKPPIGTDGNPLELHHVLQQEAGPMAELREITHQQYYSQLHGLVENGASFRNNPLLNKQYNNFRYNYWKWRANLITGGK